MLLLVLADNFLVVFVGLGAGRPVELPADRLLVPQADRRRWRRRRRSSSTASATSASRSGSWLIFVSLGTLEHPRTGRVARRIGAASTTRRSIAAIALLVFAGAMGKSAQFPLHVWLPDAMEGPTPVSALIHAATMVNAGVYLVARTNPIFAHAPEAMVVVAAIGIFTAILAASIAMTQTDIKRVLAYSTPEPARLHVRGARRRRVRRRRSST